MARLFDCETCRWRRQCMDRQIENSRRGDWVFSFARAECEPAGEREIIYKPRAGMAKSVMAVLAAGRPMTSKQIMDALGLAGRSAYASVCHAVDNAARTGAVVKVGAVKNERNTACNIWRIAGREPEVQP